MRFDTLLIANRGEIAVRIARTARRLGLSTVAIFSDADREAAHVAACDRAVHVGGSPAASSYLRIDAVIDAARHTGAQAVHPGYGFLAENAAFAAACARAGLSFVGPPTEAIQRLGSKAAAKALARSAGVPVVPGFDGDESEPGSLAAHAQAVGFPVLIKPVAGGGGKGMRRVDRAEDFPASLAACQREAQSSFGDARVLLERYIAPARHIEVQVLADAHGHCVHLLDRDCSAQRRHQKVLEEAPAPAIPAAQRAAMADAAIALARAAGYVNAGTVEFLVGPDGNFYFLEMNTRLQVEHGVTELVTGLDLVEWQLRIASGEPLALEQSQPCPRGHAIEVRLCAEDPARGFLPGAGRLRDLELPSGEGIRVDSGFRAGDVIPPFYDSLLVKIMAHGDSREQALERLQRALSQTRVVGVAHNRDFLQRLLKLRETAQARLDTGLIERELALLAPADAPEPPREAWLIAALAVIREREQPSLPRSPWALPGGWRLNGELTESVHLRFGQQTRALRVRHGPGELHIELEPRESRARILRGDARARVQIDGDQYPLDVVLVDDRCHVFLAGTEHVLDVLRPLAPGSGVDAVEHSLRSPLPGRVIAVHVAAGERVERGAALLAIEAMKMEHTVSAPSRGVVKAVRFGVGDQVGAGEELLEFDPLE